MFALIWGPPGLISRQYLQSLHVILSHFVDLLLIHKIIKGLRQTSKIEAAFLAQKSKAKLLLVKKEHVFK